MKSFATNLQKEIPLKRYLEGLVEAVEMVDVELEDFLNYFLCGKSIEFWNLLFEIGFGGGQGGQGGGPCGYVFQQNDAVYRCEDCGLDDTCVLCAQCFKASSHSSHNITVRFSNGISGGCCDCGDLEAWKVPGSCSIHCQSQSQNTTQIAEITNDLKESIANTLSVCLEFVVETLDLIDKSNTTPSDASSVEAPLEMYKSNNPANPDFYSCILWNDETHSFNEVIEQLKDTINISTQEAKICAETVDREGRIAVYSCADVHLLVSIARKLNRIGLLATVKSSKMMHREDMAMKVLEWIALLPSKIKLYELEMRYLVCTALEKKTSIHKDSAQENGGLVLEAMPETIAEVIILSNYKLWKKPRGTLKQLFIGSLLIQSEDSKKWFGRKYARHYLEFARQTLVEPHTSSKSFELSTQSLAVQLYTVPSIAHLLLTQTPILSHLCLLLKAMCMEEQYSCLPDDEPMSVADNFWEALAMAQDIRCFKYLPLNLSLDFSAINKHIYILNDLDHLVSANTSLPHSQDADFFGLDVTKAPGESLVHFLDLLCVVQGMHVQKRAIGVHVEYESEAWVGPVYNSMKMVEILEGVSENFYVVSHQSQSVDKIFYLLDKVMGWLLEWSILENVEVGGGGFHSMSFFGDRVGMRVPDRRIAFQGVSMHHGMHWLLAGLLSQLPRMTADNNDSRTRVVLEHMAKFMEKCDYSSIVEEMGIPTASYSNSEVETSRAALSFSEKMQLVLDHPLQAIAFISQVHSNIWVRNGRMIRHQISHFKETFLRGAYDYDMFLLQFSCVYFGGDLFLTTMVDRFHLVDFFKGVVIDGAAPESRFSKDHEVVLLEDFFHILIIILSDRSIVAGQTGSKKLQAEMVNFLAAAPNGLSYSVLYDNLQTSIGRLEKLKLEESISFDQILSTIATFKYPEGTSDSGVYTLKEEFYRHVDPWYNSLNRNQRESLEEILKTRIKTQKSTETVNESRTLNLPSLIPISPVFSKLDSVVHSKTFSHLLLVALWEILFPILDKGLSSLLSEMMLGEVVQLMLIAIFISRSENKYDIGDSFVHYSHAYSINVRLPSISELERSVSLLDLCLAMIDRANEFEIKDQAPRLRYIVRSLEEMGGPEIIKVISGWRDKSNWNFFEINTSISTEDLQAVDYSNEKVKRKLAAKARQAAIKAQFAQAQNTFKANFGDELNDNSDNDEMEVDSSPIDTQQHSENLFQPKQCSFPTGTCIVCQEEAKSGSNSYGMLCLVQPSSILRQVDVLDVENMARIQSAPISFDKLFDRTQFTPVTSSTINNVAPERVDAYFGNPANQNGSRIAKKGIMTSSCGHLMHLTCFERYLSSIHARQHSQPLRNHPENLKFNEFLCPLCKSLGNSILPILWPSKTEITILQGSMSLAASSAGNSPLYSQALANFKLLVNDKIPNYLKQGVEIEDFNRNVYSCMSRPFESAGLENPSRLDSIAVTYSRFLFLNLRQFQSPSDVFFSRVELSLASVLQTWDLFMYLVSGLEIASRGVGPDLAYSELNMSEARILDCVSSVNLSLLRVISETCTFSLLLKVFKNNTPIKQYVTGLLNSISGDDQGTSADDFDFVLLHRDGFTNFARICLAVFPRFGIVDTESVFQWVQFFGVFEIVRTLVSAIEGALLHGGEWLSRSELNLRGSLEIPDEDLKSFSKLIHIICGNMGAISVLKWIQSAAPIRLIYRLCYSSLLIYSRRCILFLYARFGFVVPQRSPPSSCEPGYKSRKVDSESESELLRNSTYLSLPSINEMVSLIIDGPDLAKVVLYWCSSLLKKDDTYWTSLKEEQNSNQVSSILKRQRISIDQGAIFELFTLPNRLEVLFEGALKFTCSKCGTVPRDPALCLLCGLFVCSQSQCCGDDENGECNLHMKRCGGSVGIYMLVKKCVLVILNNGNGSFNAPPYLDIHGEVDRGLKRGKPQFLNVKRYAEFRKLWLTHAFPSIVAQRLEQTVDTGGWRTL